MELWWVIEGHIPRDQIEYLEALPELAAGLKRARAEEAAAKEAATEC